MEIKNLKKFSMKESKDINENMIQEFIFNHPDCLGLGELSQVRREKIQPMGGRIDLLLEDDLHTRYEVEIQLGKTDESHIVRTIEYWDTERKRYPQYDHCAVIVAEEITGRFMNVISLFNGHIPLIAIQMSAHKIGDDVMLFFTKVLDRLEYGDEDEDQSIVVDRSYWEDKSCKNMLGLVDKVFEGLNKYTDGYELRYNKHFIGITINGIAKNFISFIPRKKFIYLKARYEYNEDIINEADGLGIEVTYDSRSKLYVLKIASLEDFEKNKEFFEKITRLAKEQYNL